METIKSIFYKQKKVLYLVIIFFFSTSINQYYGNLGVCPIDSFWFFNSGYDVLNGYYPFKDYWTIAGPFISFTQAFFFKILGTAWSNQIGLIFTFLYSSKLVLSILKKIETFFATFFTCFSYSY